MRDEVKDDPLKYSRTEKAIMIKDRYGPFSGEEVAILVFLPMILGGVLGNILMGIFGISGVTVIMVCFFFEGFLLWWILSNRKVKPPGYIIQTLYTNHDVFKQRLGYVKFAKVEKKMRSYDSVKRTRNYN